MKRRQTENEITAFYLINYCSTEDFRNWERKLCLCSLPWFPIDFRFADVEGFRRVHPIIIDLGEGIDISPICWDSLWIDGASKGVDDSSWATVADGGGEHVHWLLSLVLAVVTPRDRSNDRENVA